MATSRSATARIARSDSTTAARRRTSGGSHAHTLTRSHAHTLTSSHLRLDEFLPAYDVRERHATIVRAPVERVYEALWSADVAPPVVRLLLASRALPAAVLAWLSRPRREARGDWRRLWLRARGPVTMHDVIAGGFALLDEDPPRELVLGVVGAFWRLRGGLCAVDATSFRAPLPAGTARAAWNFHLVSRPSGGCVLSTETRVQCADAASRRRFRIYWLVVRPGSGLIRRLMLRSVRRAAEGRTKG